MANWSADKVARYTSAKRCTPQSCPSFRFLDAQEAKRPFSRDPASSTPFPSTFVNTCARASVAIYPINIPLSRLLCSRLPMASPMSMPFSVPALFLTACLAFYVFRSGVWRPYLKFFWHCFIRLIGPEARLDKVLSFTTFLVACPQPWISGSTRARQMYMIPRGMGSCVAGIPCYRCRRPTLNLSLPLHPRNDLYG